MPYQHQNTRTREAGWTGREDRLPAPSAREAFVAAYGQLRDMARATRGAAMLVAAVDSRGRERGSALIEPGHSLTVGRHTECGLRLPDDSIALRHLVAHARLEASRTAPTIHLWDLHTGRPFLTEDGQPSMAVVAHGLLYAAVGQYALLFVPTRERAALPWPAHAEAAWSMFPPRQFTEPHTHVARALPSRRLREDGQAFKTSVSREDRLLRLGEGGRSHNPWGLVRLVHGEQAVEVPMSREHLEQGVLLGRYARCGIAVETLTTLSRVHLMLIRLGEEVLAIDTASTNGTWRARRRIGTVTLGNLDALELGKHLQVQWLRLPTRGTSRDA
jgi:pSer/pThr/pTyr-binding forkhead associated (FHA) protein